MQGVDQALAQLNRIKALTSELKELKRVLKLKNVEISELKLSLQRLEGRVIAAEQAQISLSESYSALVKENDKLKKASKKREQTEESAE